MRVVIRDSQQIRAVAGHRRQTVSSRARAPVLPAGILSLQRQAGNTAVAALLSGLRRSESGVFVQRDTIAADAETLLGQKIERDHRSGVAVVFYDAAEPEAERRAGDLAAGEQAVGIKGKKVTADELVFGKAIADSLPFESTMTSLGTVLKDAVTKAGGGKDLAPAKVRTLVLVSHGTPSWCSIGAAGMSRSKATAAIKAIGPVLSTDVKVIIYACGVARGTKEDESWTKGTMEGGGADSFAGQMRDAAVDAGLTNAEVWGHTTTGHATRNPALRFFSAASGKGAEGQSYVSARIFDEWFRFIAYAELLAAIITKGFSVNDKNIERVGKYAQKYLTQQMYSCYVRATSNKENAPELMFKGVNLAEMAPLYPGEVAAIVRKYWHDKCWSDVAKENAAKKVIKATKLKKVSSAGK